MSKDLVHDATSSWWNGDIKTLCGLTFKGGKGCSDPSMDRYRSKVTTPMDRKRSMLAS